MYNYESFSEGGEKISQQLFDRDTLGISDTNLQQIFHLIDTLVSLECCVYYQIIPLSVIDNCLNLGMVDPEDISAINYINSTIAYLKYGLTPQPIDVETHEVISSEYLKYCQAKEERRKGMELSIVNADLGNSSIVVSPQDFSIDRNIFKLKDSDINDNEKPTFVIDRNAVSTSDSNSVAIDRVPLQDSLPETQKLEISDDISPQQLSKKLLSKTLQGEIGRLYFERQKSYGKIICSQEGKIQYSLDKLSLALFQGTIDEFKILTNLPPVGTENINKAEIEKTYKQERVLLRLQVLNSPKGEEGTLQVLRGKALKFYKQNKIEQIGKQALDLARGLERKLYQINAYSADLNNNNSKSLATDNLMAIQTIVQTLNQYLEIFPQND
jgi:type II secretory ATPase GspE/PulE/Tfp pilus assembly ATPase PilB-like protein